MDYKKLYNKFIKHAQKDNRIKNSNKYENHHILPECLGGTLDEYNMVLLTFREHYLVHYILTKIHYDNNDLQYAFWAMNNQQSGNSHRDYFNSRLFESAKKNVSKLMIGNNHNLGNKHSEETKKLMSEQSKGIYHHSFKGYYITPFGKYESANSSNIEGLSDVSLNKWCKNAKELMLSKTRFYQNQDLFKQEDIGKTLYEIGYDFELADRVIPKKKVKEILPENHSMFTGYYITPWGKFANTRLATKENEINTRNIQFWCKSSDNIIRKVSTTFFPDIFKIEDIGKTYKELGFGFEAIDKYKE